MSWATPYILKLRTEEEVEFRPRGNSMEPLVKDNQLVRVRRLSEEDVLRQGDIVLCTVQGRQYLHLVKAVNADRVLIGNNRGGLNGWTPRKQVHGRLVPAHLCQVSGCNNPAYKRVCYDSNAYENDKYCWACDACAKVLTP